MVFFVLVPSSMSYLCSFGGSFISYRFGDWLSVRMAREALALDAGEQRVKTGNACAVVMAVVTTQTTIASWSRPISNKIYKNAISKIIPPRHS